MNEGGNEGGNEDGKGAGGGFGSATADALRFLAGGENQLADGEERMECKGCWKNDGAGISGAGGFRNEARARAIMLGAGAALVGNLAPLLLVGGGGGATWGLLGISLTRVHRDTSSGRKQMQNRKK